MSTNAIEIEGLSKRYRLGAAIKKPASKMQALSQGLKSPFRYFIRSVTKASEDEILWALKDVSFNVAKGEVVGIIGRNGAGKTTMLKILSRITDPTSGAARVYGRVGTLLAVGTGFHPELSGRENVYLNGAIMGMRRQEIRQRFDEIVDFADVAKFIDTPVKYYSSGMYVRLAFAVAAHLEPEVLLVDEVLAVGDLVFQRKCLGRMHQVSEEGRTVLLVSHNMEAILGLCPRTVWIDQGEVASDGPSKEIVNRYTQQSMARASQERLESKQAQGPGMVRFTGFHLRDDQGRPTPHIMCGDPVELVMDYSTANGKEMRNVTVWIWIRDPLRNSLICLMTSHVNQNFERLPSKGRLVCRMDRMRLAPGSYMVDLAMQLAGRPSEKLLEAATLEVQPGDFYNSGKALAQKAMFWNEQSWSLED